MPIIYETNVDAWNYIKRKCKAGYSQQIQRGSFEGESIIREQSYPLFVEIRNPTDFLTLPKDVTIGMIEKYYNEYIVGTVQNESLNEQYTYAERIVEQLPTILEMLLETPQTNQASISISKPGDIFLHDPPCLREITFSYFNKKLNMTSYWRSNDISEAFLINQGGLALLLKDVAGYASIEIGSHFYVSPGAHTYKRTKS